MDNKYKEVIEANIALHSKMSRDYSSCEPHFRPENIAKVESRLKKALEAGTGNGNRMLDLGCGTGFMINIGKKYFKEITGVDVTQAMMDEVDKSGNAKITLINNDTGSFQVEENSYDLVTANSFLHHLYDVKPTINTALKALKKGGVFYADLDPNYYFWEAIEKLDRFGHYDPIVKREIEMVTYKDEDIEKNFGVDKLVFNNAEYGKNIAGGFKEDELVSRLCEVGFSKVEFHYDWYIGQGSLINNLAYSKEDRFIYADVMESVLQQIQPLSRHLFKYVWFHAYK